MTERLYRLLLWLSPREFREQFADELLATARSVALERGSMVQRARAVLDVLATIAGLHADFRAEARRHPQHEKATVMDSFLRDIYFAARGLRREPVFALFVVVTLSLGIGANAAIYGIADKLLLRGPEHVRDSDRVAKLLLVEHPAGSNEFTNSSFGQVEIDLLRRNTGLFDGIEGYAINEAIAGRGTAARSVRVGYAGAGLFSLLGVHPELGRFISPDDNVPNSAQRVAVLSHEVWRGEFLGASDALGKSVTIGDESYVVVGVAPAGFTGPALGRVDYWVPANLLGPRITNDWQGSWDAQWLRGVVRLKRGVTREQAAIELTSAHRRGYGGAQKSTAEARLFVAGLTTDNQGDESSDFTVLRWLTGVAVLVLLIMCANVANLLIARGLRRAREMTIRSALGASRFRIMRLLLLESLLLSGAGALMGLAIAYIVGHLARVSVFTYIGWSGSPVNSRVMIAAMLIALVAGAVIGLIPAWKVSSPNLTGALKSGHRDGGSARSQVRSTLTVVQAAFSVALLIGAGLFVRSLWQVRTLQLGVDAQRVLMISLNRTSVARISNASDRAAEIARRRNFPVLALQSLKGIPGVQHTSVAVGMPFGNRFTGPLRVPGWDSVPKLSTGSPSVSAVTSEYFATAGTRIVRGRSFTNADRAGSERVAIVNATMAEILWPGADAIGRCISPFADSLPCARIIGVAENTRRSKLSEEPTMHFYVPYGQEQGIGGATLLLSTAGDPRALMPAVQRVLSNLDATVLYVSGTTLQEQIDPQSRSWRLGAAVFAASGVLALIVAAFGIYSLMSYLIVDRHHEIGVRVALGAKPSDIMALVLKGSLVMAGLGVVIGEMLALSMSSFVQPLLFETSSKDVLVFSAVGALLLSVAVLATLLPAFRARRINPLEALRAE